MGVHGYPIEEEELQRDILEEINGKVVSGEDCKKPPKDDSNNKLHQNEALGSVKDSWLSKAKDYALCLKPGLMEEMKELLSEEDYKFLANDFAWYVGISIGTILVSLLLLGVCVLFSWNNWVFFASMVCFFGGNVATNLWKGKYWHYVRRSTRSKKIGKTEKELAAEIFDFREKREAPPVNTGYIISFVVIALACAIIAL